MSSTYLFDEIRTIFISALLIGGIPLGVAAATGLLLAIILAVTQIQDQTLPQIVKIVVISSILFVSGATLCLPIFIQADRLFKNFAFIVR
jgi:type III secretory pathway component EscS